MKTLKLLIKTSFYQIVSRLKSSEGNCSSDNVSEIVSGNDRFVIRQSLQVIRYCTKSQ